LPNFVMLGRRSALVFYFLFLAKSMILPSLNNNFCPFFFVSKSNNLNKKNRQNFIQKRKKFWVRGKHTIKLEK
jgi:hypothetical protein